MYCLNERCVQGVISVLKPCKCEYLIRIAESPWSSPYCWQKNPPLMLIIATPWVDFSTWLSIGFAEQRKRSPLAPNPLQRSCSLTTTAQSFSLSHFPCKCSQKSLMPFSHMRWNLKMLLRCSRGGGMWEPKCPQHSVLISTQQRASSVALNLLSRKQHFPPRDFCLTSCLLCALDGPSVTQPL